MNRLNSLFRGDRVVWIVFFALCIVSVVEVFSALSTLTYKSESFIDPILRHAVFLGVGLLVVLVVHRIPCRYFKILMPLGLMFSIITLFCLLMGWGVSLNGAVRWLNVFGIPLQPSEIAKGSLIITVAYILSSMQTKDGADKRTMKYVLVFTVIICGLILPENFSTAVILFGVVVLMMFIGRVPLLQLGKLLGVLAIAGGLALGALLSITDSQADFIRDHVKGGGRVPVWRDRLVKHTEDKSTVKMNPDSFDIFNNAQVGHANIAIASSHFIGCGPGNSVQRDFLSQAYSDFIYAIIVEELGLVGAAFVVLLYVVLLFRVSYIAKRCENSCFPAFLAMGLALLLVCQAMVNMMVATGLFPVTGQPLPLISRGGTSTLINCAYIGMILSVSRLASRQDKRRRAAKNETFVEAADDYEDFPDEERVIPPAEQTAKDIEAGKFD